MLKYIAAQLSFTYRLHCLLNECDTLCWVIKNVAKGITEVSELWFITMMLKKVSYESMLSSMLNSNDHTLDVMMHIM